MTAIIATITTIPNNIKMVFGKALRCKNSGGGRDGGDGGGGDREGGGGGDGEGGGNIPQP